jgi:ectoine hydroxylase-related dioxygenase (phytanoyl-CoA dioxygenase family)
MATTHGQPTVKPDYTITYRLSKQFSKQPVREIPVYATPAEIQQLVQQGYLIRERLFQEEALERLRTALDEVETQERAGQTVSSRGFGGLFIRYLMDKHPLFLEMLKFQPTLSVARAVLGPLVQIRGFSARISYPNEPNQEVQWHIHQKFVPNPQPAFFVHPHALDCLIYLDELTDDNGPLCFLPGSHLDTEMDFPSQDFTDLPGQVLVKVPAGSCVIIHSNLWHRALPTQPNGGKRRLLLVTYTPTWMRQAPYGVKPQNGLTQALIEGADEETRELLGLGGYS